jgi:hypothetical protein
MALTIGGGIKLSGQLTLSTTTIPLTAGLIFEYNASNSMCYSGSGANFSDAGFNNGPNDYNINYLFDLNSDYANATLGKSGVFTTSTGFASDYWVSQGGSSYFKFVNTDYTYIDTDALNGPVLSAGSYTCFAMVLVNDFGAPDNPGTWTGGIVGGNQTLFGFLPPGGESPFNYPVLVAGTSFNADVIDANTEFQTNTWYAVAVTYNAVNQTMNLYVDGVNTATATEIAPLSAAESLYWGTWEGINWLNGNMGVMTAWNRALSGAEITAYTNIVKGPYQDIPLQPYSQIYTTPGVYQFTVPAGVTSISLVAVGAGGGGTQDAYSLPGQLSGVFNQSSEVSASTNLTASGTNQIIVDSATYPDILTVTTDYVVSSIDLTNYYPNLGGAAIAVVTSIDTADLGNVVVTVNKPFNSTQGDQFNFIKALVAADGGLEITDSQYTNGNGGPGPRALPLVYNAGGGRGGVVDYLDSWGLGGGGAGGYGIKNNPFVSLDPNQTYLYNTNDGNTNTGVANVIIELSNYDLTATAVGNTSFGYTATGTYAIEPTDKVMFSITQDIWAGTDTMAIGLGNYNANIQNYVGGDTNSIGYFDDGIVFYNGSEVVTGLPTFPDNGQIIDIAVDRNNNSMWIRIDGGYWNGNISENPATNTGGIEIMQGTPEDPNLYLMLNVGYDTEHGSMSINNSNAYTIPSGFAFIAGDAAGGSTGGDGSYYDWFTAKSGQQADGGGSGAGGGGRYEDSGTGGGGVGLYGVINPGTLGTWANQDDLAANYIDAIAVGGNGGSTRSYSGTQGGQATAWNGGYGGWPGGGGGSATGYYDSGNGGALAFSNDIAVTPGQELTVFVGKGGLGVDDGGSGANGAVRIIWPGNTRLFPYTLVGIDPAGPSSITIGASDFANGGGSGQMGVTTSGGYVTGITSNGGNNLVDSYVYMYSPANDTLAQDITAFFRQARMTTFNTLNYIGATPNPNVFNAYIFDVTWADSSTGKVRMSWNTSGNLTISVIDTAYTDWQTAAPGTQNSFPTNPVKAGTFNFPATFTPYTPLTESWGQAWC